MIDGLHVYPLTVISDDRGKIMHMIRRDASFFTDFGEIYFSIVNRSVVKAWKQHARMTQRMAVPVGHVRLVAFDDREGSSTRGYLDVVEFGEDDYKLIQIPSMVWYGFVGMAKSPSLIANCTDLPHDPAEVTLISANDSRVPYSWHE